MWVEKQDLIVIYLSTSVSLFQMQRFERGEETSLIALRAVWRVQAFCFWVFVGKSCVSDVVCVAMVIIILLNGIHSELISYCQTAIKQIRLCILTSLKYFQFVLNFGACEKHWSGKWRINSKGSSSCTGFLFPPPLLPGWGIWEWRHCRTFWGLNSPICRLETSFQMAAAAAPVTIQNWTSISHDCPAPQRKFSLAGHWKKPPWR